MNWISVDDYLPSGDKVLVTDGKLVWTAEYWPEHKYWSPWIGDQGGPVTHWIYFKDVPKP